MTTAGVTRGRRRVAVVLCIAALTAAACSSTSEDVADQSKAGVSKGYVAGDGTVQQLAPDSRETVINLSGTTIDGSSWSQSVDGAGRVVVINVWGSWCPPCVEEIPALQRVWSSKTAASKPVVFVGVNIKESPATALAFVRANAVTYPSISDGASGGAPMLALQGKAPATPTTLVLDRQGRLAARVLGPITAATLTALVDEVISETG